MRMGLLSGRMARMEADRIIPVHSLPGNSMLFRAKVLSIGTDILFVIWL